MRVAQFPLQSQRPFRTRLPARHSDVVEALARRRQKERRRIFERERTRRLRIRRNIALAQLRQNRLERTPKAIQHADAVAQRHHGRPRVFVRHRVIRSKRELRLRVLRMHQERRAPVDSGLQQTNTFVRRIPALDHDVIQLIAQELVYDALVLIAHFQKIRQRADRS